MPFLTVVGLISFVIFAIACVTIYHNTNSYEPSKRIIYIIVRNNYYLCDNFYDMWYGRKRDRGKKRRGFK